MERLVSDALTAAGDVAGAAVWRRACADLGGPLTVAVAGRDAALVHRLAAALPDTLTVEVLFTAEDAALGAHDRLLGAHAVVWATPVGGALGVEERAAIASLRTAPSARGVVVADLHLLAQMSDEPEREAADVLARARQVAPEGWPVLAPTELAGWLAALGPLAELTRERRQAIARLLLEDARARAEAERARTSAALAEVDALLAAEDATLEQARRAGARTAGHLLGVLRRRTEELLLDVRAFLERLEKDVPGQVAEVGDLDTVRRALPHWVAHVVDAYVGGRLADWRARVLEDLADLRIPTAELDRAELLAPALHPPPIREDAGWNHRIAVSAALGGGLAMLAFGLWLPGALALSGGLGLTAVGRSAREAQSRDKLVEGAVTAVRRMGEDADLRLRDQLAQLEAELSRLADDRVSELGAARACVRARLEDRRRRLEADLGERTRARDELGAVTV